MEKHGPGKGTIDPGKISNSVPAKYLKVSITLARTANILLWIGESIILFVKNDRWQLAAANIKLTAGALLIIAAAVEGQEKEKVIGFLPIENPPKVFGATVSEVGGIILTHVLAYEVKEKEPSKSPVISPFIGGVGAIQ